MAEATTESIDADGFIGFVSYGRLAHPNRSLRRLHAGFAHGPEHLLIRERLGCR